MKIITLTFIVIFLSSGCANIKQFIDVDDMLTVGAGSNKSQILSTIGKPSMVRSGIKLKNGEVHEIWIYNVKKNLTKQILDFNRLLPAFILSGVKSDKDFKGNGWSGNKLYGFMFLNDELYKWGFLGDDWPQFEKSDGDYLPPNTGSKMASSSGIPGISSGGFLSKIPIIGKLF
jgi:hypothetical protein|tara:strand:- start:105 stop:626 length:522 start_codon:yes stop_codon:yes gene_type:complete